MMTQRSVLLANNYASRFTKDQLMAINKYIHELMYQSNSVGNETGVGDFQSTSLYLVAIQLYSRYVNFQSCSTE